MPWIKERAAQPGTKAIVLTEDENPRLLEGLLEASGFTMGETAVLPCYGISTIKQLRPLVRMITGANSGAKIVVHRDRDYLSGVEANAWETDVRSLGVEPFLTTNVDVEAEFLVPQYLAMQNPQASAADFKRLVDTGRSEMRDDSVSRYVNGRIDILRRRGEHASLNHGQLALEAAQAVDGNPLRWSHDKSVVKRLRANFQREYGTSLLMGKSNAQLSNAELRTISKKIFGTK